MTFTRDVGLYRSCIEELSRENLNAVLNTIPSHFAVEEELGSVQSS